MVSVPDAEYQIPEVAQLHLLWLDMLQRCASNSNLVLCASNSILSAAGAAVCLM
jgi:hypothetical protein